MANVNLVRIPYKGTAPAMTAVMSGEVHAMFASAGGAAPHVKSGRLRAIAVGSARPSALAPGLPTIADSGLPGYVSEALHALFAPAKTPAAIVARLNQEVVRYLQSAEAKDIFLKAGTERAYSGLVRSNTCPFGSRYLRSVSVPRSELMIPPWRTAPLASTFADSWSMSSTRNPKWCNPRRLSPFMLTFDGCMITRLTTPSDSPIAVSVCRTRSIPKDFS
jgi:hypothetical protein